MHLNIIRLFARSQLASERAMLRFLHGHRFFLSSLRSLVTMAAGDAQVTRPLSQPQLQLQPTPATDLPTTTNRQGPKLHGRAFYESIGSPKFIVAPMVDQSEFAWRMLSRSFLSDQEKSKMLAYTPMFHARLFSEDPKYQTAHFQATRPDSTDDTCWLDGNPANDRPLFVQFCANDPAVLLAAASKVAPHCDAVDLNLGCPQGIARKGRYGAFLQEDQDLVFRLINALHTGLPVPVTAKIRILETREQTLAYARTVLRAGASILTVHGRRREQKSHMTGVADWATLRFLRDSLPPETVLFANGNVLQHADVDACLAATGFDGVMSAEGNLSDPAVFAEPPPPGAEGTEYWRGSDGRGGWRVDAVMRRYLDIIHRYVLETEPPARRPLFMPGHDTAWLSPASDADADADADVDVERAKKRRKTDKSNGGGGDKTPRRLELASPNLVAMKPHLFHLLRHLVTKHTDVRDMLARAGPRAGTATAAAVVDGFEAVLAAVERRVAEGMLEYERTGGASFAAELAALAAAPLPTADPAAGSSVEAMVRCRRPWWVAQPIVRPLPGEAMAKGSIRLKKARGEAEQK